jgi:RNA polymerase sigma-70 factor (ECF subfamily)
LVTPSWHAGLPEADLVRAAQAGDGKALEALVVRFWPAAHRIAYLLLQDREAAEDTAQDALLRAVRALGSFEIGRPLSPWINRIAANCAHDALRKRARQPALRGEGVEALQESVAEDLADEVARTALSAELEAGLARLNPDMREAVVLRHLLEYTPEEIAEIAGVPAGTVRTRIHRGLTALRATLAEPKEAALD